LGLSHWKIFYTDEEAETLRERQPAADTSWNIRFNLVPGDGRFLNLRLRLRGDQMTDSLAVRENVKAALINRLRQDHLQRIQ
jgi:hypothetical protein